MAEHDYDNLLMQLRLCHTPGSCHHCTIDAAKCHRKISKLSLEVQAAVAFEALQSENAQLKTQIPQWVSVDERLPENEEIVLVYWCNAHCCERDNYSVMRFYKGRTAEELKAANTIRPCDQWGNNKKPYCWNDPHGPLSLFGQDVTYWMPLPEPPLEEYELEGGIFDPYFVEGFE